MTINNLKNITVFVDESGSVPKKACKGNNFFIITLLFVEDINIDHLKKIFKRSRLKIAKKKDELMNELKKSKEIKGSMVSEKNKFIIYNEIIEKCSEKFELAVIVFDCSKATDGFKANSSRAFNYLIKTYLNSHFRNCSKYKEVNSVKFIIDERNVATGSKYTLKEYLNTELNLMEPFANEDIDVHYYDSKKYLLLQMADFISNTFYRKIQKNNDDFGNVELLLKQTCKGNIFKFPLEYSKR
ncbi:MAG: DUF3800 domain-containing protein [Clostridium baratii]